MAGVRGRSGGRNAKTVKAHKLQGTFQKVRHGGVKNPEPPAGVPVPPKPLAGDALHEWNRMLARLAVSKTLSSVDDGVLYQYCQMFAETEGIALAQEETAATVRILQENLDGLHELSFEDLLAAAQEITKLRKLEAGYITKVRQGRMALRTYLVEFGLTPASRGRVKLTDAAPKKDEWDDLDATVQ
jgi:P27 family predicted phage terminase small subunit